MDTREIRFRGGVGTVCSKQVGTTDPTEDYLRELHDALAHLRDLPLRESHPLCQIIEHRSPITTAQLQRHLLQAIEELRPPDLVAPDAPRARRYRYLKLRYVDGASLDRVNAELGLGERQARREGRAALQELGVLLQQSLATSSDTVNIAQTGRDDTTEKPRRILMEAPASADLESELMQVEAEPHLQVIDLAAAVYDAVDLLRPLAAKHTISIDPPSITCTINIMASRSILRQVLLNAVGYFLGDGRSPRLDLIVSPGGSDAELRIDIVGSEGAFQEMGPPLAHANYPPPLLAARHLIESQDGILRLIPSSGSVSGAHLVFLTVQSPLVLIVDDNLDLGRLFRRFLRGRGFRLVQAQNAYRAHDLARALSPDVILLDLMMPVRDGWDLFNALRHDPETANVPVVACSILPERDLALSLGATDFLAKPVTPESLLAVLDPYRRQRKSRMT